MNAGAKHTVIKNGRVVSEGEVRVTDVRIEGDRIAAIGPFDGEPADRVIDASGCYVLPGFVDFHVHLDDRIGRFYLADTYESGSRIALQNGITTICSFVTQGPGQSLREAIRIAREKAGGETHCDLLWHLTPTTFAEPDWTDIQEFLASGYRTIKLYTTYKPAGIFADQARLQEVFEKLGPLGATFLLHCEDDDVIAGIDLPPLELAHAFSHTRLRPEEAEVLAVERLLALALRTGARLHVVHVSTSEAASRIRIARETQDVTSETCPQYLWLDHGWLTREDGHRWLCSPPLRGGREAFRDLAASGTFDFFTTDHCAFRCADKDDWNRRDIRGVANGLAGLGALPHLVWRLWSDDPDRAAVEMALRLSRNPAQRAGIGARKGSLEPGFDADVVVLDPNGPDHPVRSSLADAVETYPGFTSPLSFRHVLLRGRPAVAGSLLTSPGEPAGQILQEPV